MSSNCTGTLVCASGMVSPSCRLWALRPRTYWRYLSPSADRGRTLIRVSAGMRPTFLSSLSSASAPVEEALRRHDLLDDLGGARPVRRHDHRRHPAALGMLVAGLASHGRRGDVDAVLSEDRADPPDHPGDVGVAEEREVVLDLD